MTVMSLFPRDNFRRVAPLLRFLLIAVLGLSLDLWTKHHSFATLGHWAPDGSLRSRVHAFLPGHLEFQVTANHGAVFGIGEGQRYLFLAVSLAAIVFLFYLFAHSGSQRIYQVLLGLLMAGVLGNLYDRLAFGYVRDMIHALPAWHWPGQWTIPFTDYPHSPDRPVFPWIFNIADVLLCAGVSAMILYSLFLAPKPEKTAASPSPRPAKQTPASS